MTIQRMIELLAFERKCVESADECDRNCAECNLVQDTDELLEMYSEVILLLKAQKTRVMTLEEVKQWCEIHPYKQNPIWVEFQHGYGTDGWRVGLVNSGLLFWCKDKEARCWTSRPDDATREAIPWE